MQSVGVGLQTVFKRDGDSAVLATYRSVLYLSGAIMDRLVEG